MYEDNAGAKSLGEISQGSDRSKHIDVRFYFLRGLVRLGAGNNSHCSLGGSTCGYPYEATRARGVPEAP